MSERSITHLIQIIEYSSIVYFKLSDCDNCVTEFGDTVGLYIFVVT